MAVLATLTDTVAVPHALRDGEPLALVDDDPLRVRVALPHTEDVGDVLRQAIGDMRADRVRLLHAVVEGELLPLRDVDTE